MIKLRRVITIIGWGEKKGDTNLFCRHYPWYQNASFLHKKS